MRCLGDYLVVVQGERATERKGIILPDSAQENSNVGVVVAIGPLVCTIAVGDTVLIPLPTMVRVAHTKVCDLMIDDKPAVVLQERDVAVLWEKDDAS